MSAVSTHAVFLSYASQDAAAAQRICEALHGAGVEVWFDRSELRGGDAWDAKIRKQIKECALFVPIISENTQSRPEGYFRLEWHLAEQRSHLMARERPFIVPLAIDDTRDEDALVPDAFLAVQWMRVPGGEATPAFCERVKALLAASDLVKDRHLVPKPESRGHDESISPSRSLANGSPRMPRWLRPVLAGAVVVAVALAIALVKSKSGTTPPPAVPKATDASLATEKLSPARELTERVRAMLDKGHLTRDQLETADELCEHALQLDPTDALVWAQAARVDLLLIFPYGYDSSAARRKRAQERATRALNLAPDDLAVRVIHAATLAHAVGTPALIAEAEKTFRELAASHPNDQELVRQLAEVLREEHRYHEAAKLFEGIDEFEVAGWSYFEGGDMRAALTVVKRAPRSVTVLQLTTLLERCGNEDLAAAQAAIDQMQPSELLAETVGSEAMRIALFRRDFARLLEIGRGLSRDFIDGNGFHGPRAYFTGLAQQLAGQTEKAAAEWRGGLVVVESMLKTSPDDRQLLLWSAWLHAALEDTTEAEKNFARSQALAGLTGDTLDFANFGLLLRLRKKEAVLIGAEHYFKAKRPLWQIMHSELRFSPEADFLRGDPRFEKLLRDYLPVGAKPFDGVPSAPSGDRKSAV